MLYRFYLNACFAYKKFQRYLNSLNVEADDLFIILSYHFTLKQSCDFLKLSEWN